MSQVGCCPEGKGITLFFLGFQSGELVSGDRPVLALLVLGVKTCALGSRFLQGLLLPQLAGNKRPGQQPSNGVGGNVKQHNTR